MFNKIKLTCFSIAMATFCTLAYANARINSVTMVPPAPNFGQAVTVTLDYCAKLYADNYMAMAFSTSSFFQNAALSGVGQVFVISNRGVDVATSQPATSPGGRIDWLANTQTGYMVSPPCQDCGNEDGQHYSKTYIVHVPSSDYFPGCSNTNLNLLVAMKDSNLHEGEWISQTLGCNANNSNTWTIPVLDPSIQIQKRSEGVITNIDDMVLFSMDYEYANSTLSITDPIPGMGNLEVVSWGPKTITGGSVTGASVGQFTGSITWNFQDRVGAPGTSNGTVWILMKVRSAIAAGTPITNIATATGSSGLNLSASTSVVAGQATLNISKRQSVNPPDTAAMYGNITYYLEYSVNGYNMKAYRSFDDISSGVYTYGTNIPGLKYVTAGQPGTWTVSDPCYTGDSYITGSWTSEVYPQILLDDIDPANVQFCTGVIMADVMINPGGYEGSDAMVVIRSNGNGTSANTYGLLLSVDNAPLNGYVGIQKCSGSTCSWYNGGVTANAAGISNNKWFRTKTQVTVAGGGYKFDVKVWVKGDPEPGALTMSWTDVGADTNAAWTCGGSGSFNDWRPGVAEQRGSGGTTEDSYNNFVVYVPNASASTVIYDTVPSGIAYMGSNPSASSTLGGVVSWNLTGVENQSGTLTWWGQITGCNPLTNSANISGGAPVAINKMSNEVWVNVLCGTPSFTMTSTPTRTATPLPGTPTDTATITPTRTITSTFTDTRTATSTPSVTPTCTPAPANLMLALVPIDTSVKAGGTAQISIVVVNTGAERADGYTLTITLPDPLLATFELLDPDGLMIAENAEWTISGSTLTRVINAPLNPGQQAEYLFTLTTIDTLTSGTRIDLQAVVADYNLYPAPSPASPASVISNTSFFTVGDIVVYPNPFNPDTAVGGVCKFANLPKDTSIAIYTISGEMVVSFRNRTAYVLWDGRNTNEKRVSPGIYYYIIKLKDDDEKKIGKIYVIGK